MMSLDARKSVERYIEKYGPEAFDRVVKAVSKKNIYINKILSMILDLDIFCHMHFACVLIKEEMMLFCRLRKKQGGIEELFVKLN